MTAKEYLSRVRRLQREIAANAEQIQRMRAMAERTTAAYGEHSGGGGGAPDRRAELVAGIVDMERALERDNAEMIRIWRRANAEIDRLPREAHRTILKMRYLGNMSWARIAEKMGYCERQVRRIHISALKAFEKYVLECPHGDVL